VPAYYADELVRSLAPTAAAATSVAEGDAER